MCFIGPRSFCSQRHLDELRRVVWRQLDGWDVQLEPRRLLPLQAAVAARRILHHHQLPLRPPAAKTQPAEIRAFYMKRRNSTHPLQTWTMHPLLLLEADSDPVLIQRYHCGCLSDCYFPGTMVISLNAQMICSCVM